MIVAVAVSSSGSLAWPGLARSHLGLLPPTEVLAESDGGVDLVLPGGVQGGLPPLSYSQGGAVLFVRYWRGQTSAKTVLVNFH